MMNYPDTKRRVEAGAMMKFESTKGFGFLVMKEKNDKNGNPMYSIIPDDNTFSQESRVSLYKGKEISAHTSRRYYAKGWMTVQSHNIDYSMDNIFRVIHAYPEKFYK